MYLIQGEGEKQNTGMHAAAGFMSLSIMFNVKDDTNLDFRRRILLGRIKPEAVVSMTFSDMASEQRKKETEGIKAKSMFECELGATAVASTDQFKCGKCLQRKTTYSRCRQGAC
ncbi:transcription elongation factor TFIIS-like [Physcomitrium patens]